MKKHKVSGVHIRPADNGGHTVSTSYDEGSGPYQPPVDHVFGADEHGAMMNHVGSTLGVGEDQETAADEAKESPAVQKAEAKAGTEKHKFPMKGRANLAMQMVRRSEATSKAKVVKK